MQKRIIITIALIALLVPLTALCVPVVASAQNLDFVYPAVTYGWTYNNDNQYKVPVFTPETEGTYFALDSGLYWELGTDSPSDNDTLSIQISGSETWSENVAYYDVRFDNVYNDQWNVSTVIPIIIRFLVKQQSATITYSVWNPSTGMFDVYVDNVSPNSDGAYPVNRTFPENYFIQNIIYFDYIYVQVVANNANENPDSVSPDVTIDVLSVGSDIQSVYQSNLQGLEITEVQVNWFASVWASVDGFLQAEVLPGISFWDILIMVVAIPLLIAILKIWLGG